MNERTKDKVISAYMASLARKSHAAIKRSPEALERSRARAAKMREALKAKRAARKVALEAAGKS
jgi:hypothetical protein